MMQNSRSTIIYLNSGVLRVMGTDGSATAQLLDTGIPGRLQTRDFTRRGAWPPPCDVDQLPEYQQKNKDGAILVVGMDGRLNPPARRRGQHGRSVTSAFSPDGQDGAVPGASDHARSGTVVALLHAADPSAPEIRSGWTDSADGHQPPIRPGSPATAPDRPSGGRVPQWHRGEGNLAKSGD
jgi:hypothetical protein